jgi:hypothetical protein
MIKNVLAKRLYEKEMKELIYDSLNHIDDDEEV